jgi:hypothetical protein
MGERGRGISSGALTTLRRPDELARIDALLDMRRFRAI